MNFNQEQEIAKIVNFRPVLNVTDFLTFLCYRRTHTLPDNLNFNMFFDDLQHMKERKKVKERSKLCSLRSFDKVDNNNEGDPNKMRVFLRRLFLDDSCSEKETKDKILTSQSRKRSSKKIEKPLKIKKKPVNTRKNALVNVQNVKKQSERCLRSSVKSSQTTQSEMSKSETSKQIKKHEEDFTITLRKTDKTGVKSLAKSSNTTDKQKTRRNSNNKAKTKKICNNNEIKFIRN